MTRTAVVSAAAGLLLAVTACGERSTLPPSLADHAWWELSETLSEPPGRFDVSENLVSNELGLSERARRLRRSGGVYIGVGPEQNFTYIATLRPAIAFIVDIRRENRSLHLLYKALFELSPDRPSFLSRLFSRVRPEALGPNASVRELFDAMEHAPASRASLAQTQTDVRERLLTTRTLPVEAPDLEWIDRALAAFHDAGPAIHFWGTRNVDAVRPSYRALMTAPDGAGRVRSFLASEDAFAFVKTLHTRNLIVPVIGNFGADGALRRIGDFARRHAASVTAFYGSNVGVYLTNAQTSTFCANLYALPIARRAMFIESNVVRPFQSKLEACAAPAR